MIKFREVLESAGYIFKYKLKCASTLEKTQVIERDALRAVEQQNYELLPVPCDGLTAAEAREAVRNDLMSIGAIRDEGVRYQAAVVMGDNARTQSNYRAQLQILSPEVAKEVQAARPIVPPEASANGFAP